MKLVRLVYASKLSAHTNPSELAEISRRSAENNQKNFLSGILVFGNDYFLQCLEGDFKMSAQSALQLLLEVRDVN